MPRQYPGVIPRQELVEFTISATKPKILDSGELYESIETFESMSGDHQLTIHSLQESIMENTGYQRAMRDVNEWAKAHVVQEDGSMVNKTGEIDRNNMFAKCTDPIQLIHVFAGRASGTWVGGTGHLEYDSDDAQEICIHAIKRLRELGVQGI